MAANHMKKIMLTVNTDGVDDARVFQDLLCYSEGKINLDPNEFHLHEFKAELTAQANKKKKKK